MRLCTIALIAALVSSSPARPADPADTWRQRLDHWAFRPMRRPSVPAASRADWPRTDVDRFVLARLDALNLRPAPEADRRTLIRRLHFDLIGLPPEPERVDAFVRDPRPDAYERLVDELLASPHHGERWARHWLDVVHYGETHGYDKDKPRPNAWPYRDYVIRAFNEGRPYARFIREQLAGDVFFPNTRDGREALGFIAAGPWDFIGHAEVPETKIDGMITRHLDRDDMVGNALGSFMSLTVQCAQCHNHKFDPITQEDYYRLQSVFASLDRADMRYDLDPEVAQARARLLPRRDSLKDSLFQLDQSLAKSGGRRVELLNRLIQEATKGRELPERVEFGYHSQIETKAEVVKWVQIDLGEAQSIVRIVYAACHDMFNNIGAGFGFPPRFKVEISDQADFSTATIIENCMSADVPNPGVKPREVRVENKTARYIRFTATKLAPRQNDFIFALAEMQVFDQAGRNLALGAVVSSKDSIEALPRWTRGNLTDGYWYGSIVKRSADEIAALTRERDTAVARAGDRGAATRRETIARDLAQVEAELGRLPAPRVVFAGMVHHGTGTFRGTGPDGGKPRTIRLLNRGDVKKPGPEVSPGAVVALTTAHGLPEFSLPKNHAEGARRAALAEWIAHPSNPLTWRSIVNRVWQYHFGRGLVDTPNDFGHMGQPPSHPELLDWLAIEFRDSGGSLKKLHKLIVTSSVYRQSSQVPANERDAGNVYLARMNRRKLEAECVRDAVLVVAGKLDVKPGGPSFQDFVIEHPEHSPHYEYHKHDPEDARTHRRSIYRFIVRSQPQPFMTTLDCADPSMRVDKRNESLSPMQALTLRNNAFMVAMAKHFAARIERLSTDPPGQVAAAFRLALGRTPSSEETQLMTAYAKGYGMANMCRVILNLNEFVFVD